MDETWRGMTVAPERKTGGRHWIGDIRFPDVTAEQ